MECVRVSTKPWRSPADQPECEVALSPELWDAILEQSGDDEQPEASTSTTPDLGRKSVAICLLAANKRPQHPGPLQSIVCWATRSEVPKSGKSEVGRAFSSLWYTPDAPSTSLPSCSASLCKRHSQICLALHMCICPSSQLRSSHCPASSSVLRRAHAMNGLRRQTIWKKCFSRGTAADGYTGRVKALITLPQQGDTAIV